MNAISQVAFYCNRNTVILRLARDLIVAPIYVVWEDLDPLCISRSVSVYQDLDLAQDTYSQAADVSSLPMRARCAARWSDDLAGNPLYVNILWGFDLLSEVLSLVLRGLRGLGRLRWHKHIPIVVQLH